MKDPARRTTEKGWSGCEIVLLNPNRYRETGLRRLRPWLAALVAELAPDAVTLGVRFVSDREMRRSNLHFRGQDKATDVLSFPGDDGHLGDVLIAVPVARRLAAAAGHGVDAEIRTLLLHGVLHCLGYDHETDRGEMARLERRLRRRWIHISIHKGSHE